MDVDNSGHSDSICSDDTEYLLGQNISIREIDNFDLASQDEAPPYMATSHHYSPQRSPQKSPPMRSTKQLRSPTRLGVHKKPVTPMRNSGEFRQQWSPEKVPVRGASRHSPVEPFTSKGKRRVAKKARAVRGYNSEDISPGQGVAFQDNHIASERGQFYQDSPNKTRSKKLGRESTHKSPQFKSAGSPKRKQTPQRDSAYEDMNLRHAPVTRNNAIGQQRKKPLTTKQHIAINEENWEVDSEISLDMVNGGYHTLQAETSELESVMSEATEDLISREDSDNDDITEKLKELNLAVNYDNGTNEYFDDKVREGAELLSKLFGGNVDNYYGSSRVELTMATNLSNQSRWKRQPLRILRVYSGQSISSGSGSGSVQEVSRTDSHAEDRRNLSDSGNSSAQRTLNRVTTPQPRAKLNMSSADHSNSFGSNASVSGRRQGSATRKEVRFQDDITSSGSRHLKDHQQRGTDGEFIRETSAFRAAMDYDNDDDEDDDNSDDDDIEREQKEAFHTKVDGHHIEQTRGRRLENPGNTLKRKEVREPERNIGVQSPSRHRNETRNNTAYENQLGANHYSKDDFREWKHEQGTHQPFEGNYTSSPYKDRDDQRFQAEKFSDSGHSRRPGPTTDSFMTSTPQTKEHAIFSPPQSYQSDKKDSQKEIQRLVHKLQEMERKLNRSSQELKDVESEIEDAKTRKMVVIKEIHALEETVGRNRAEVQSSENLVEQYRQQATKTRSQLMELELQRDNLQHEIKEMRNCLARQKQETKQAVEVEKTNGLKVLELSIEKDQLNSEVDSLKTQLHQAEGSLTLEKQNYLAKIGLLQDQLHEEQRMSKESVEKLKQQLEVERQKARDSHYERINAIHKLQDESKEMHEKDLEVLKNRLVREKETELEAIREKAKREYEALNRKLQDRDSRIGQLEDDLKENESDVIKLKAQVFQEQQKLFDYESEWKENVARQENQTKTLKTEVDTLKQKEVAFQEKQRKTEELLEHKMLELKRVEEKSTSQADELNQIVKNKNDEITMLRGLVRQQEDATRLLGEKMRNEAQEHIRHALEKERESTDKERTRHQAKLEEIRDKYEAALKQLREELETERQSHSHLNNSVNKIKKEVERLRELNLQGEQERVIAVAQVRSEAKEEVEKMKGKIRELSSVAERSEKETILEINEECRKTAAMLGESANTTPVRNLSGSFLGDSPRSVTESPAREALVHLRSYNEELRQHLTEARKELELSNRELALKKQQQNSGDLSLQQVNLFKKALKGKEDEVARLKRLLQEETERSKSERATYQKTVERLERELKQIKAATPNNSPMVNGTSPTESGVGTSLSSASASPRPGEDSSSARLLRHLQGRVQQLRAQNDTLRRSSESESLNDSHSSVMSAELANGFGDDEMKKLHSALKISEDKAQRNAAMLSQKMMEMTKLQKMLTHATKENMKLERAYASLQRKIIDSSR